LRGTGLSQLDLRLQGISNGPIITGGGSSGNAGRGLSSWCWTGPPAVLGHPMGGGPGDRGSRAEHTALAGRLPPLEARSAPMRQGMISELDQRSFPWARPRRANSGRTSQRDPEPSSLSEAPAGNLLSAKCPCQQWRIGAARRHPFLDYLRGALACRCGGLDNAPLEIADAVPRGHGAGFATKLPGPEPVDPGRRRGLRPALSMRPLSPRVRPILPS